VPRASLSVGERELCMEEKTALLGCQTGVAAANQRF
jgi:hypothetical protein